MDTDRNELAKSTEQCSPALASLSGVSTMADLAPAPPKKRALPFKRTVARTPVEASTDLGKPDDDNVLDMFRHAAENLPELLWEAEEKVHRERDAKRRRTSLETTPAQAAKYVRCNGASPWNLRPCTDQRCRAQAKVNLERRASDQ